jgi:hypothetical protein
VISGYRIEGHAIVSGDDRIADANGVTPPSLHNDADWARFQRALDEAVVTVLGRRAHEAHPNPKRRNRLVLSSSARGVERRPDGWWWNPARVPLISALRQAAPTGGIVAVPGGQGVFDFLLEAGFEAFHLARKASVRIPDGVTLFSAIAEGVTAAALLTKHGLIAGPVEALDAGAGVTLTIWRCATP